METPPDKNEDQILQDAILQGYVDSDAAEEMLQGREFLRVGIKPTLNNQRVEVSVFLKDTQGYPTTYGFQISGQVIRIKADPSADNNYFPMANENDTNGSHFLSGMQGETTIQRDHAHLLPDGITLKMCDCDEPGCQKGLLFMSKERYFKNKSDGRKTKIVIMLEEGSVVFMGAKHGQRIVCEGRLNYDIDMQRGNDEPPWSDNIPMDGRDVYSFELVFNDHMKNMWVLDVATLQNLGRRHRPRCWPWTNEDQLPYERTGEDIDARRCDGVMFYHRCLGPFGCDGTDHEHRLRDGAA